MEDNIFKKIALWHQEGKIRDHVMNDLMELDKSAMNGGALSAVIGAAAPAVAEYALKKIPREAKTKALTENREEFLQKTLSKNFGDDIKRYEAGETLIKPPSMDDMIWADNLVIKNSPNTIASDSTLRANTVAQLARSRDNATPEMVKALLDTDRAHAQNNQEGSYDRLITGLANSSKDVLSKGLLSKFGSDTETEKKAFIKRQKKPASYRLDRHKLALENCLNDELLENKNVRTLAYKVREVLTRSLPR